LSVGSAREEHAALDHLRLQVVANTDFERLQDLRRQRDLFAISDLDERPLVSLVFGSYLLPDEPGAHEIVA
jgi:hypothetical protein